MSDPNVTTIAIPGAAASDYIKNMNGGGGKRTRRKVKQQGGDPGEDMSSMTSPVNSNVNTTGNLNIKKIGGALSPAPVNIPQPQPQSQPQLQPQQQGGQKPKIVIAPKQKSRKIIIAPKHQQKPIIKPHQAKKRKLTKRLCVPITVVKNKIAKTRKHITESQQLPIDKIRKTLIDAKLLNPASKAPETLIRKIYADFKIIE